MASAVWKLPVRWRAPGLCDRTALYPALYLRWTGNRVAIARDPAPGRWEAADLRVLVTDGALTEDEQELMARSAARDLGMILAPQSPLSPSDLERAAAQGIPVVAWTDGGPFAAPPPHRPGLQVLEMSGCAARPAEDMVLFDELAAGTPPMPPAMLAGAPYLVAAIESAAAFAELWPALRRHMAETGVRLVLTSESEAALFDAAGLSGASMIDPADPALSALIANAEAFLCVYPDASPDSPRPAQWARTALFLGAPVIATSHPGLDGLAHLVVMDDWERGLRLYSRFPIERMKAVVTGQAFVAERVQPERIAAEWAGLLAPAPQGRKRGRRAPSTAPRQPQLLVLVDIHQDLDVLLPVLLALKQRDEVRLRIIVTDWLVSDSPRVLNLLAAYGLVFEVHEREAIRAGAAPLLGGVDGVLCGAETNTRAHKAGHTLVGRAHERGAASFTLQHGFENIGLTYKDHLHGEQIRFASRTIFTWGPSESLAPWIAPETRAAATPVGSPKTAPAPAKALRLNQGFWPRTVGVFENLHWHRFDDAYRARVIAELGRAAAAHEDTLFIVKPHHAGRWLSRHRELIRERANLVVTDPTDSAWEPHTAPAFIASVDAVLTTPSTVALDAARTGRPVAVLGYGLELPLYEPLPIIGGPADLDAFLADESDAYLLSNEAFLRRARLPGRADHRIAARIAAALRLRVESRGRRRRPAFSG